MDTSKAIGNRGEDLACQWLLSHGYALIERNYRSRWCEIDIVAKKDQVIYIVEVKFRKNNSYGGGFDYITSKKQQQMNFAAEFWMKQRGYTGDCQLAAASIDGETGEVEFIDEI